MAKIYFKKLFLSSKKLNTEIQIAFGLISIAILVFLGYLFPGVSSLFGPKMWLHIAIVLALFIIVIGFLIIMQIVEPIIRITNEAKLIADGNLEREIEMAREDEIGELGMALNQMTRRIKDNVDELQKYSKQTESINSEINRRVVILASLVEVSNLIAQNAELQLILKTATDKCLEFGNMTLGCLILKDRGSGEFKIQLLIGNKSEELTQRGVKENPIKLGKGLVGKAILKQNSVVLDQNVQATEEIEEFRQLFGISNAVLAPIASKGNVFGLLITGNELPDFICASTEREFFGLLAKQIAIAINNDILIHEIEKLEVTDHLTGLFNNAFTRKRLTEEIKRASNAQQPCSFVLFMVDQFDEFHKCFGHIAAESILLKVASILKESISPSDKAARFGDHEFAVIMPGKNKRESIKVAEDIRKRIEQSFFKEEDERRRLTCAGAITENPIDGVTADELILKSGVLLAEAMQQGGNRIAH